MSGSIDYTRVPARVVGAVCGVTERTVRGWQADGCPVTREGKRVWFSIPAVIAWRIETAAADSGRADTSRSGDAEWSAIQAEAGLDDADVCQMDEVPDQLDRNLMAGQSYYQELGRKRAARLARLKLEEASGRLIDIDTVRRLVDRLAAASRSVLEMCGSNLCDVCKPSFSREAERSIDRVADDVSRAIGGDA